MKNYLLLWILLALLLFAVLMLFAYGWDILPFSSIQLLVIATVIGALVVANEMKRPMPKEYYRQKAMNPAIPAKYLSDEPPTDGIVFGRDHKTGKFVVESNGHCMVVGSTGSGKTACCILPSILSHSTGSLQVIDIKSRELTYKSADILDNNTIIVDLDHKAPYVYGWDILYRLKRDGTDTEQDVLRVLQEVSSIVIPKSKSGDQFWNDSARALFIGLSLYEICYEQNFEFIDVVQTLMNVPLRDHLDKALNTVPKTSIVASYLTGLANTADETLFSCDITMCSFFYQFLSEEIVYCLRDNPKRADPTMLNKEGVRQYLCVSEEKLSSGFSRVMNMILKQTLVELQSRTTGGEYPRVNLVWDEYQKMTEDLEEMRTFTASFLKTARSKNCALTIVAQNLDGFDKSTVYDTISNVHYLYVLSSNNANSLTSEVVCKMAGSYYEKAVSTSEGKGTSKSTSFQEKPILSPEDLNCLGEDAVLIITNHGFVKVHREGSAYYKTEPFKAKYEKILSVNRTAMEGV